MCAAIFTAHAQSGIPLSDAQRQIKQSHTVIDKIGEFSDKLLAPNAKQIKQSAQLRSSTASSSPVDLGDGLFLLDGNTDPSSSLVEAKINAAQWSSLISGNYYKVMRDISNLVYTKFNDDFDFVFFVLDMKEDGNIINNLGFYGINLSISNNVQGLGLPIYNYEFPVWGSAGKLKSAMFFPFQNAILVGPALHELCHNWAAYIQPIPYLQDNTPINESYSYQGHWGISNAGGQLGGFKYVRTVQENCDGVQGKTLYQASFSSNETNPDGSFKYSGFGVNANGGNGLPYSDIELYLMGMKSAQELRDADFHLDIYSGNSYNPDGDLSFANGYFYSTAKTSYTIDDIIAMDGTRVPDASVSQKQFKVLTVAISNETASDNYYSQIIQNVGWFAGEINDNTYRGLYNFRQATNNVGSLVVDGVKNSLKQPVTIPALSVSPNLLIFTAPGGQNSFTITSNTDWAVSSDTPWATVSSASGSNNSTETVFAAQNTTANQRIATIAVSGTGGTLRSIQVIQESTTSYIVQTWNLTPTMTATLDNDGVLTVFTSKNAEAMPDYISYNPPWNDVSNNIRSVIIEDKVTAIGAESFAHYTNLTSVAIPNSVETIGDDAFFYAGLTSATIPYSVKSIGGYAFAGCSSLSSIIVDENNMYFTSNDGVLYNKSQTVLYCYPGGKSGVSFSIPNSVTEIASEAFFGNYYNLTSIVIPNSVNTIGDGAFMYCFYIKNVTVNWSTPLPVPDYIFYGVTTSAATLHVPAGTKALYQAAPVWKDFGIIDDGTVNSELDFESDELGHTYPSIAWYPDDLSAIVENSPQNGGKALHIINKNWNSYPKFSITLPEGKTLADVEKISFDLYFNGINAVDGQMPNSYKNLDYFFGAQGAYFVPDKPTGSLANFIANPPDNPAQTWLTKEFAPTIEDENLRSLNEFEFGFGININAAGNYFLDNITFVLKEGETLNSTQTIMYVMNNGQIIFESPVSDIDNVTFDKAAPDSALIVQKNDGSSTNNILLNNIQQLSFSDGNLSLETPNGIEMYAFEDIAKLFFGYTINTGINNPPAQSGLDVLVSITPTGDAAVKSSVPIKSLTLFSVDGKMISKKHCNGMVETWHAASLQDRPAGVYLLRVETTQGMVVKKVVQPSNK